MKQGKRGYTYDYPRPAVTVDVVIFRVHEDAPQALLIQRANEPFAGSWAFPGGFLDVGPDAASQGEDLPDAAARELLEETGLAAEAASMIPFGVFGTPGRDPRGRTISVAYLALLEAGRAARVRGGDDAARAHWFPVEELAGMSLAFDHEEVLAAALERLRFEVYRSDLLRTLLPTSFTAAQYRRLCERLLGKIFPCTRHALLVRRMIADGTLCRCDAPAGGGTRRYRFPA